MILIRRDIQKKVLVNFRSGKTVRYSESDYEVLIGKFVKITDLYFEDFDVDKKNS